MSKQIPNSKPQIQNFKILGLLVGMVIVLVLVINSSFVKKISSKQVPEENPASLVKSVSAQEIYPMFECPCCGKPIDECTCPMAKERRAFVEGLTSGDVSEDQAVMAYVKKYGLESFIDENKQTEFKEKLIAQAPVNRPIIAVVPGTFDFGEVSQKKGVKITFFEIKNEGKSDLIIDRLESSCGCTSASILSGGREGPKFSMPGHKDSEEVEDWQVSLSPEETARLKVYYDPEVHPDFRGAVTRTVSIFSNDPIDFEKKVQIELNQVD